MSRFTTVMGCFLLFLFIAPMLSGCATLEAKMVEWRLDMVAPWADDKPLVLDECYGCFHLGPLQYDEMLLALRHVE